MSTYIIGDVQGCFESLMSLLEIIKMSDADQVWLVGDLVNRGPRSLDVLRWAMSRSSQVRIVLGNHDLHLLACMSGASEGEGDTLEDVLKAPNAKEITEWLRAQPILYESRVAERDIAMVHAGVNPRWSWAITQERARAIEGALQTDEGLRLLAVAHPTRKPKGKQREEMRRARETEWIRDLEWFTRVRAIDAHLTPYRKFKGALGDLKPGLTPWFQSYEALRDRANGPDHLYFGHWAALGLHTGPSYTALDSGCIWGRYLSAIRVEDGAIFQTPTVEQALTPKNLRVARQTGASELNR